MFVYMYVCMCVSICVCIHDFMYVCIYTYVRLYILRIHLHACFFACVSMRIITQCPSEYVLCPTVSWREERRDERRPNSPYRCPLPFTVRSSVCACAGGGFHNGRSFSISSRRASEGVRSHNLPLSELFLVCRSFFSETSPLRLRVRPWFGVPPSRSPCLSS